MDVIHYGHGKGEVMDVIHYGHGKGEVMDDYYGHDSLWPW